METKAWIVPKQDRVKYIQALAVIAMANLKAEKEEVDFIEAVMKNWKFNQKEKTLVRSVLKKGGNIESIVKGIKNKESKYLLLHDLINIAYIEGNYSKDEKMAIRVFASIAGISMKRVSDVEKWYAQGIVWRQKGYALLKPE